MREGSTSKSSVELVDVDPKRSFLRLLFNGLEEQISEKIDEGVNIDSEANNISNADDGYLLKTIIIND